MVSVIILKLLICRYAKEGAGVARDARESVERRLGKSVISAERAIDHTNPSDSLPLNQPGDFGDGENLL